MSSAITEVVVSVNKYVEAIVKASSLGRHTYTDSAANLSTTFAMFALIIISIKFWLDIIEENSKHKGVDKIDGVLQALRFLGMRLFVIPLIFFASAIPYTFYDMTPNGYHAIGKIVKHISSLGDTLISKIGIVYSLHIDRQIDGNIAGTRGNSHEEQLVRKVKTIHDAANSEYRTADSTVKDLEARKNMASNSSTLTAWFHWNQGDQQKLDNAIKKRNLANNLLDNTSTSFGSVTSSIKKQANAAKTLAELESSRKQMDAATADSPQESSIFKILSAALGSEEDHPSGAASPLTGFKEIFSGIASIGRSLVSVVHFVLHIGFYLCLLPAFIGLIAGAIICLKEALSLLQYGAKIEILKNLTFGIATIFGPIFMLCFLFSKTEQFAWKLLTLMFSMYFGFFALSYACATLITPGLGQLNGIMNQLTTISVSQLGECASIELLVASVAIGLKGLSVGMIAAFLLDIVKSAIAVGHSLIGGNFSISS